MRRFLLLAVFVMGLALAPVALAVHPSTRASQIASYIAGKPVTDYCSTSYHLPDGAAGNTVPGTDQSLLGAPICNSLTPASPMFVEALHVVIHEAFHAQGMVDEGATDCAAARATPGVLRRFYPTVIVRRYMAVLEVGRDGLPPAYRTVC